MHGGRASSGGPRSISSISEMRSQSEIAAGGNEAHPSIFDSKKMRQVGSSLNSACSIIDVRRAFDA